VNILGDAFGAGIIESMSKDELDKLPMHTDDSEHEPSKEQATHLNGNATEVRL
jgi:hypothetical protein